MMDESKNRYNLSKYGQILANPNPEIITKIKSLMEQGVFPFSLARWLGDDKIMLQFNTQDDIYNEVMDCLKE